MISLKSMLVYHLIGKQFHFIGKIDGPMMFLLAYDIMAVAYCEDIPEQLPLVLLHDRIFATLRDGNSVIE